MSPQDAHPETSGVPTSTGFRARFGAGLDRIPFRRKLNTLVAVPVVVISVLFGIIITGEVGVAEGTGTQAQLIRDSAQVALLNDDLRAEQQQAILLWVRYDAQRAEPATSKMGLPDDFAYGEAEQATDAQARKVSAAFGSSIPAGEAMALQQLASLGDIRAEVTRGALAADNIDSAYGSASAQILDGLGLTGDTTGYVVLSQTLDALLRADSDHAAYETSLLSAQTGDEDALIEFNSAVQDYGQYQEQEQRFGELASSAQSTAFSAVDFNSSQVQLNTEYSALEDNSGAATGILQQASSAQDNSMYLSVSMEADIRQRTVEALVLQIAQTADGDASSAGWQTIFLLALAALVFLTWVTLSVLIRHSVVRPVQQLTAAARNVAEVSGRELARVADDDAQDESPPRLEAVPVLAKDELGELAVAFNRVQITAAGLLERQITSRRNIAEMFGNVGRRVSNLTTRQLTLIDAAERSETDPELLERLYRIDHIAVRMQRNADSLMLLAGIRETELDGRPAPLTHAVRSSLGQIEGYQRVALYAEADPAVSPDVLGDLVLMLAELLENAVSFSPAHSNVEVTVRSAPGGQATVEIVDHGLGMGSERLEEENSRLVRRERLDLVPTKVLGLFVVGTLARRWGIAVTLFRTPGGGVTAVVTVPAALLTSAPPVPAPAPIAAPTLMIEPQPAPAPAIAAAPQQYALTTGPAHTPAVAPPADGALPRRPLRRPHDDEPEHSQAGAEAPAADTARPPAEPSVGAGPALRRRVRGATLEGRPDASPLPSAPQAPPLPPKELDPDAVRDSMEEFEAAVRRAELDSTRTDLRTPERPEGTGS